MADLTFPILPISSQSRGHGFPTFPTPPLGGMGNGKGSGMESRVEFQLLLKAAMRACDHHGDGHEARAEMSRQCLATPKHLRADLLEHFLMTYGGGA